MPAEFRIWQGDDGDYYFHFQAGNNRVLVTSQGYERKESAERAIQVIKTTAPDAPVDDQTS